jgi:uncharacterized membrane protein YhaH (DUF805 family)
MQPDDNEAGFDLDDKEEAGFDLDDKEEAGFDLDDKEEAGFDLDDKEPVPSQPESSHAQQLGPPRNYDQMVSQIQPTSTTSFIPPVADQVAAGGPLAAVSAALRNTFDFSGRASRSEYWWFVLAFWVLYLTSIVLAPTIGVLVLLAGIVPIVSVGVRRLHDLDKSGWWFLISYIPFAGLLLFYWFVSGGEQNSNRFGPPATKY